MKTDYEGSRDSWLMADEIVRTWEDDYRTNPTKQLGDIGAFLVSDRVRRYDGQDYEKVFLSANLPSTISCWAISTTLGSR